MASGLSLARTAKSVGIELGHVALGSASEVVGGGGLGFVHAKWKDKWYGEYAPEMAAGVGKVALALARGFGGADNWLVDIVGGVLASPGMVLTSAKYGIMLTSDDAGPRISNLGVVVANNVIDGATGGIGIYMGNATSGQACPASQSIARGGV